MPASQPVNRGILELLDLANPALATPAFQRSFAWAQDQVDDYWRDLKRAIDATGGPDDYFLGLLVLDDSDQIQDGQQRLATTLLFASAMYEFAESAKAAGNYTAQLAIDALAQITSVLRQSPQAPLQISLQDQDILLNRAGIRSDSPESARRLEAARKRLQGHLKDDLATKTTPDAQLSRIKEWGEFLRDGAYVVLLRVPTRDAHNIFETLNTRGVRLSNGDLVKSHLIAGATNTALAVNKWNQITDALKDGNGRYEEDLESFLLHYYGSRYAKTTKNDFFLDYRRKIEGVDALVVLDELIASASIYRALVDPASKAAYWTTIGAGTQQAVELLNGLGLKQLRYLLLAVLRDMGANLNAATRHRTQREAMLKIAAWSVRALVQGETGGGDAERTYILGAAGIRDGTMATVGKLRQHFVAREMLVRDNRIFKERFKRFEFDRRASHTRARAILYALEYEKISNKSGLKPRETLTVEHVLPQSPAAGEWTQFGDDERSLYTYNLGNLLLVDGPSRANDQLGNREWPAKKALIRSWGNQTPLTTEALRRQQWTASTIDRRHEELAKVAVRAFGV